MNTLQALVLSADKQEGISFVKLQYQDKILSAMISDTHCTQGQMLKVLFKESDVMVARKDNIYLSARNKFLSPITKICQNSILARVYFAFGETTITSLISSEALKELRLQKDEEFLWFVKSSDLILQEI